jgi:tRNA threonylcarbamoyladenosine biosynthesis protein TsaE
MTDEPFEVHASSAADTEAVGAALAGWLANGDVLLLHGDLGAGKTTFVKGIARGLGVAAVVSSPSFGLVNDYDGGPNAPVARLHHLDLYRLRDAEELETIGFSELISPSEGTTVIEWPERAIGALPDRYLLIEFHDLGEDRRRLRLSLAPPDSAWGQRPQALRVRLEPWQSAIS